jgi:hypothetical protein
LAPPGGGEQWLAGACGRENVAARIIAGAPSGMSRSARSPCIFAPRLLLQVLLLAAMKVQRVDITDSEVAASASLANYGETRLTPPPNVLLGGSTRRCALLLHALLP